LEGEMKTLNRTMTTDEFLGYLRDSKATRRLSRELCDAIDLRARRERVALLAKAS
jgi:hypothetical protein